MTQIIKKTLQICQKLYFRQNSRFLSYMSASGPLSHWRALSALSSWLVYKRKLGVSGMYWAVIKSMTGAPAQTSASWRQSNLAPIAKADKRPICDATLVAEHRLPRMEGWAISLMYNWDVNWKLEERRHSIRFFFMWELVVSFSLWNWGMIFYVKCAKMWFLLQKKWKEKRKEVTTTFYAIKKKLL